MEIEEKKLIVEIWKETIAVQRHFNEIGMRIRGMFVTLLLAFFAAIGFLIDKNMKLRFGGLTVQYAVLIPFLGIFTTWLFYFIDRRWYHRLLVGAVKHAVDVEQRHQNDIPELNLSSYIAKESPYKPGKILGFLFGPLVRDEKWRQTKELHSDGKIELFYKSVMALLLVIAAVFALAGGLRWESQRATRASTSTNQTIVEKRSFTRVERTANGTNNSTSITATETIETATPRENTK